MTADQKIENSILPSYVVPLMVVLRTQGVDPMEILEELGVDPARFANPNWRFPLPVLNQFAAQCEERTGLPEFGLLAAQHLNPQSLNRLGLAWVSSGTVLDGLKRLVRFHRIVNTGSRLAMEEEGEHVSLFQDVGSAAVDYHPVLSDYGLASVLRMCELNLGEYIPALSIDCTRAPPPDPEKWERLLGARVTFGAPGSRLVWSRSDVLQPVAHFDPDMLQGIDEEAEIYLDRVLDHPLSRDVMRRIAERLPDGPPAQSQIASDLAMSERTLQRHLKDEGTSYKVILKDFRLQLARKYLASPARSIVETAYVLGFAEPSAFSRAFKSWTGQSPQDYRQTLFS